MGKTKPNEDPSEVFVCTKKGVFGGQLIRVGREYTRGQLIAKGGAVPDYFKSKGTPEAAEAKGEVDMSDGFKTNKERASYLIAKGKHPPARATTPILKSLIEALMSEKDPLNG